MRRDDARRAAVKAGRDILLPAGDKIAFGGLGTDADMDTEAKASRFGDVFHDLHLRAVITDPVDIEAFRRGFDVGRDAVNHRILPVLGSVDAFETLRRIGAREGARVV
jgi:hypothetical protein